MPFWIPAPHAKRAGNWLTLRRWTHRGLSVCALLDASQFPAPSAWGAGLLPPTATPAILELPNAQRRPSACWHLPCGTPLCPRLGGWGRPRARRLGWRRAPRFARLPWPLRQPGWHSYRPNRPKADCATSARTGLCQTVVGPGAGRPAQPAGFHVRSPDYDCSPKAERQQAACPSGGPAPGLFELRPWLHHLPLSCALVAGPVAGDELRKHGSKDQDRIGAIPTVQQSGSKS